MRINKLLTNGYTLTEEEKANLKVTLEDVIGEIQSEEGYWRPFVNGTNGNLYWDWDTSPTGNTPAQRKILYWPAFSADPENSHLLWKLDDDESWTDLNITTSGARGPQGEPGQKGADGTSIRLVGTETVAGGTQVTLGWGTSDTSAFVIPSGAAGTPGTDGVSPNVTTSALPETTQHPQGGTSVTITDKTGDHQFNVWNGINGQGATVNLFEGTGIQITEDGTDYTIGVSADYALKSELPNLSPYATKTYANEASANALSEAETWVTQKNFATSAGLDANKQYAMTTNGWSDFTIPSVPDITPSNGLSANGHTVGISNADIGADKQYAWTQQGWSEVIVPSTSGYLPLSGGTVSGSVKFSVATGNNILAVASAASLIGASRQTSGHYGQDNTALGTTWFGVGGPGMHQGFIKYTDGGNVGDLNSNSTIQVNLKPSTNKYDSVQVQINGNEAGYLIPAQIHHGSYTPSADDGILHIIVEN